MGPTTARILAIDPQDLDVYLPEILRIYGAAFATPPYTRQLSDVHHFAASFERHAARRDFRLLVAAGSGSGRLLGFTYGYAGAPGQWWHDSVARVLDSGTRARWLDGSYELVELAVDPVAQGQGIGARLHDTLLGGLAYPTAVLSTAQAETNASHLYRKRGWVTLRPGFIFPGGSIPFVIMGLDLQRWSPPAPGIGA